MYTLYIVFVHFVYPYIYEIATPIFGVVQFPTNIIFYSLERPSKGVRCRLMPFLPCLTRPKVAKLLACRHVLALEKEVGV